MMWTHQLAITICGGVIMRLKKWAYLAVAILLLINTMSAFGEDTANETQLNESQFLKNIRQLTYEGKRAGEGYFSEDGRTLIFQSERESGNPFYQIYTLDLKTGDSHRVSPGVGKTTCAFFRPGTDEVLFASTHLDPEAVAKQKAELDFRASGKERRYSWDYDENMDIFSAQRDGNDLKRLTDAMGYDAEGSYSPDGSKIVFCSLRDAYPSENLSQEERKLMEVDPAYFGEIYIMNADGSDQKRLTHVPGYDGGPFFSPDGERIIWRRFDESGMNADIYTMRTDGSDVRQLTDFDSMSWAPYLHSSNQYAIFASNKFGFSNFELFLVDALGEHEPVRVTHTDGFDGLPVFSPDGARLCWTSNRTRTNQSQLFIADWNHEAALMAIAATPKREGVQATEPGPVVEEEKISKAHLKDFVEYLASDELEGRMTGSKGAESAADYIAGYFQAIGLEPVGENESYFQEFEFTSGMKVIEEENAFKVIKKEHGAVQILEFKVESDFRPLSFSANGEVEGEVVFAGYGLSVPGKLGEGYDSYAGLDVKDKIVLVLRYVPEEVETERRQELNRYAGLRYKAMVAREHGAKAILVVTGPNSPNAGELAPLSFDSSLAGSGIVAASISGEVAKVLFAGSEKVLKEVQDQLDIENPHFEGQFPLKNVTVKISTAVERVKKTDRNVLALLPPAEPSSEMEYLIIGAHYDHIGYGEIGSLAGKDEEGQIHNGADDNASGTAVVLQLAAVLAEQKDLHKGIIFALWSGEELGLIGSSHFVEHPTVPLEQVVAYINFDMVGRLRENRFNLQGVGSSTLWRKLIEKRNVAAGFDLILQDDPYLPTDTTAFYPKKVPVLSFFTGSHENYNRPTDDPETLNYDGMQRIATFAHHLITDVAQSPERPDYVEVQRATPEGGSRETLRAYLGTIPDYTTEIEGVKISGVRGGSPADKAGLKGGDIIIKFGGQKITNIYDYTYALEAVKIGEPVEVVILRDGKQTTLKATPEARK
jgi:Tol biopolymer transport system component